MITAHRLNELVRRARAGEELSLRPGELSDIVRELATLRTTEGGDNRTGRFLSDARALTVRGGELGLLQAALWEAALRWQGITTWRPDAGTPLA